MKSKLNKNLQFPAWSIALAILAVCGIAYGILSAQLGFYWDDWAKTAVNVLYGFSGYKDYYAFDRPLSGWTHILFVSLIGNSRVGWQFLNLILRWAAGFSMLWCFTRLWPQARREITLAALLFVVYPIFNQQAIAVTFHQQLLQYSLIFLSLGVMVEAVRRPRWFWPLTVLSLLLSALQLTVTEYFVGVLLIRPVMLWILATEGQPSFRTRLKITFQHYWPYALAFGGYSIFRIFFLQLPVEDPYRASTLVDLIQNPLAATFKWGKIAVTDILQTLLGSWAPVFGLGLQLNTTPMTMLSWIAAAVCAALLVFFLYRLAIPETTAAAQKRWVGQAVILGLIAVILGIAPAWIIGRQVLDDFHANRYALPAMFGASLLLTAGFAWLTSFRWKQLVLLVSMAVGLSAAYQLRIENDFRWIWNDQANLYWQLFWRAPQLENGTAVFFENEPFPDQGLFSTSAALNLLYPQPSNPENVAYWAYTLNPRFSNALPQPEGVNLKAAFRSFSFTGSSQDSIFLHFDPQRSNCWWVLGPEDASNPYLSDLERSWVSLTNFERIQPEPLSESGPAQELFGKEPEHGWCYLYEKADLARQLEDWNAVTALGDQAAEQGFTPNAQASNVPREWLPFIEGYAHSGAWEKAVELTDASLEQDPKYAGMLCNLWKNLQPQDSAGQSARDQVFAALGCAE